MVLEDGSHETAGLGRFGFAGVSTSVPISIIDMDETSRLAFTKANKLSPPQAVSHPKALSSGIQAKHRVRGTTDGSNACSRLLQVRVRRPSDQHTSMSLHEFSAKLAKTKHRAAVLLDASEVSASAGKPSKI